MSKVLLTFFSITFGILIFFSFQSPTQFNSVNELCEKAVEFADNEQFDSAAIFFEKARKSAQQKKVQSALQTVLEKEMAFWSERTDLDNSVKRNKFFTLWIEFNSDSKFRQFYYDVQSALFLDEMKMDSFNRYYEKALKEIEQNSDWNYKVMYNTFIAQRLFYKYDYSQAFKYLNLAEKSLKNVKDPLHPDLSGFYFVCNELYLAVGDFEKALDYSIICLEIEKKIKPVNYDDLITAYNNIAVNYDELDDTENALKYYKEIIKFIDKTDNVSDKSLVYANMGDCYKNLGKTNESVQAYRNSIQYSSSEKSDVVDRIYIFHGFADLFLKGNNFDSAYHYAERALELGEKSRKRIEFCYEIIGRIAIKAKDMKKAKHYLKKAEPIFLKKYGEKNINTSRFLKNLADFHIADKNYIESIKTLQRALAANTLENLDSFNFRKNPDVRFVVDKELMMNELRLKSIALDSMRVNKIADIKAVDIFNTSKATVDILMQISQNINNRSKLFLLNERTHTLFQHAIYYALLAAEEEKDDQYKEEAFLLSERSKSILLFESLKEKNALRFAGIPDSLIEKENGLRKYAIFIEKQKRDAVNEKKQEKIAEYDRELLEIQQEIDKITVVLRQKYPAYYQLKYPALKIKPKDIMSKLGDSTVMLEYFQGKQRSFVFVLRNNSFDCHQIVADSTVTNRVLDFQKLVSNLPYAVKSPEEYFGKYSSSALEMYNFWLKPYLSPKDKGKRLVIISDGSLSYMPFDALLTQKPETKQANYSNLPYLLRAYTVNYDYSAQLWLQHQQPKPQLNGKILAMAPTYIKKSEDTLAFSTRMRIGKERNLRDGITELPGAEKEFKLLKNSYKGFYPTKINASERVWKKNAADYGIIHFAMHGLIDENEPEFSSLVFAEDGDAQEDNFLYAYEIKQSKLNASLVVLSACEAGIGKYQRGEGVMSIGRGFMYAGVPAVVMTLWKLNDQSAAELIGNFYKNLAKGMQKDKALQQAKLQYLEASNNNTAHPALWACLMQLGDYSAIKIEKVNYFNYLIMAGLLLAAFGLLYFYLRKKKIQ